ncbi:hypothetical protein MLP_08260 [Microlunatus phosphovorus NM-1]|uniref:Uncharacterized protein n=1 Tax=Microlunatus phosphovorus (strain ATCC 700054 / DSM 10555 / JCM 9379 / NBRC 101784 / NCIMB 13414 / VKM Ac-1990 / NM-1) TaxID=1032480 RepID=F5XLW1_MICPN|nr:hypothetical protein MLP_08260 [Microlunatus phosphovorus NM-1]
MDLSHCCGAFFRLACPRRAGLGAALRACGAQDLWVRPNPHGSAPRRRVSASVMIRASSPRIIPFSAG